MVKSSGRCRVSPVIVKDNRAFLFWKGSILKSMETSRNKIIFKNVAPAILANACVFLFSVVDGIFVGNGAGIQALGAVNLALPFVLATNALNAMASIGGVTVTAIRFGRGDKDGAQNAFMHSFTISLMISWLMSKRAEVSLFHIGLATPASSIVQIILCGVYFLILLRKQKSAEHKLKSQI